MNHNNDLEKENNDISDRYYEISKDFTILSATVFVSSIAFVSGKEVNWLFFVGEVLLFGTFLFGAIQLYVHLKAKESMYYLFLKYRYQNELIVNKKGIDRTELKLIEDEVRHLTRLYDQGQKGFLYNLLGKIPVEGLFGIVFIAMIFGLLFILLSLGTLLKW